MKAHVQKLLVVLTFVAGLNHANADSFYVSNDGNTQIVKITADGLSSVFTTNNGYGLVFDGDGNLYTQPHDNPRIIVKIMPDGTRSTFANQQFAPNDTAGSLKFDNSGNLYVAYPNANSVWKYSSAGIDQGRFGSYIARPNDLAFDQSGNLYVADFSGGNVTKISTNGNTTIFVSIPYAVGVVFDRFGNLYVSDLYDNQIQKFATNGTQLATYTSPLLDHPYGLAFDSQGNLYATSQDNNSVVKFTTNGVASVFASSGLNHPTLIAIVPDTKFSVDIKMFAGVVLKNGNLGSNYLIQATANVGSSNWTTLTNVTLPSTNYIYIDYNSPTNPQQFYRALPQ